MSWWHRLWRRRQMEEQLEKEVRFHLDQHTADLIAHGRAPFRCRAGSRYLYVDEHGKVGWCSQTRGAFERDLEAYSYKDLEEQFHTAKSCSDGCTVGCVRSASVYDRWRPQLRRGAAGNLALRLSVFVPPVGDEM